MSIKEDENFAKALEAFYRKRGYSDLERVRAALEAYFPRAIAEAVAAERERCLRIVMREGITPAIPDDPDPVAEAINGALQNIHEAIRSAAK